MYQKMMLFKTKENQQKTVIYFWNFRTKTLRRFMWIISGKSPKLIPLQNF